MNDEQIQEALAVAGIDTNAVAASWLDSVSLLAALDAVARQGGHAVVKIDGGRDRGPAGGDGAPVYTVVVGAGNLADEFFRKDGSDLRDLLRDALSFYLARAIPRGQQKDGDSE